MIAIANNRIFLKPHHTLVVAQETIWKNQRKSKTKLDGFNPDGDFVFVWKSRGSMFAVPNCQLTRFPTRRC